MGPNRQSAEARDPFAAAAVRVFGAQRDKRTRDACIVHWQAQRRLTPARRTIGVRDEPSVTDDLAGIPQGPWVQESRGLHRTFPMRVAIHLPPLRVAKAKLEILSTTSENLTSGRKAEAPRYFGKLTANCFQDPYFKLTSFPEGGL